MWPAKARPPTVAQWRVHTRVAHKNFWWGWEGGRGVGYLSLSDRWRVTDSIDSGSWLHSAKLSFIDTLLTQFDIRLQNPAYKHLGVADYRLWKSSEPTKQEIDQVVATEKCFARSNPCISGAHRFFGRAKQEYFSIPQEQREGMQDAKSFIKFWQGIVVKKELPNPLQHYAAAILLACCSSLPVAPPVTQSGPSVY